MSALAERVDDGDGWERLALAVLAVPPDGLAAAIREWVRDFDGPRGVHAELAAVLDHWHTGKRGGEKTARRQTMVAFWTAAGLSIAEIVHELHAMGEAVTARTVSNDREELERVYESIRDSSFQTPCNDL